MLDEVVERRRWLTRERFLHLMAVTNLLPGPNSSEVAIHVGWTQRGWPGALVTGLAFLLPTFLLVLLLSWLYFSWGTLPAVEPLFRGLEPVIVAIIVWAGLKLGRTAVKSPLLLALAVAGVLVGWLAGSWAVLALLLGGAVTWVEWRWWRDGRGRSGADNGGSGPPPDADGGPPPDADVRPQVCTGIIPLVFPALPLAAGSLPLVFWTHLWIGAVLFGGGYVLVPLLEPQAVGRHGWLTSAQFLDGVALTQAVPGPISTLSAFVGYAAAGVPGAVLGTAGIYLPAFLSVLLVAPHLERVRALEGVRAALDGVSAVVAGAILGVAASLLPAAVRDLAAVGLLALALALLSSGRVQALWVVLMGLVAGVVRLLLG